MTGDAARRVREQRLTYLAPERLAALGDAAAAIERGGVAGDVVERGVALGGSAILQAASMGEGRSCHGYDVFATNPPPGAPDDRESHARYGIIASCTSEGIGGDEYHGYVPNLDQVRLGADPGRPEPHVAVVVPVYKQPQYLADAVISAVRQRPAGSVRVVVVNDGCPYPSTHEVGTDLARAHPEIVHYVRKSNGGLANARNVGIRHALATWPSVRAIFPLDSDNRLDPDALDRMWRTLEEAGPEAGFATPSLETFGTTDHTWDWVGDFTVLRQLFENQADAGSLIRREVFEGGVFFDDSMRSGYEDWEFFLRSSTAGWRRADAGRAGFRYRVRGGSMLSESRGEHDRVYAQVTAAAVDHLAPKALTRREDDELPRYALCEIDRDAVRALTIAGSAGKRHDLHDWLAGVRGSRGGELRKGMFVPPVVVAADAITFALLERARLLPGVLWTLQHLLREHWLVDLVVERSADRSLLMAAEVTPETGHAPVGVAMSSHTLGRNILGEEGRSDAVLAAPVRLVIRVSGAVAPDLPTATDVRERVMAAAERARDAVPEPSPAHPSGGQGSNSEWALRRHMIDLDTTFPWAAAEEGRDVFFVLPWLRLGGVDLCALRLARELAARPGFRLHAVLTAESEVEADWNDLLPFRTITSVADVPPAERGRALVNLLRSADVIVNAHSALAFDLLPDIKASTSAPILVWLHVIDGSEHGAPVGYPDEAARRYDQLIDRFLIVSHRLGRRLVNLGATPEKLLLAPNAPVVAPTLDRGLELARKKATRRVTPDQPLRLLFAGRLDHQKGVQRLAGIARVLDRADARVHLRIVGRSVFGVQEYDLPPRRSTVTPPVFDSATLSELYAESDVFLLPSRWEGLPLALLDAMAHANIVIATDVGAVGELVVDEVNGFLLDPSASDEEIAEEGAERVMQILAAPAAMQAMRENAVRTALSRSWERTAELVAPAFEATR